MNNRDAKQEKPHLSTGLSDHDQRILYHVLLNNALKLGQGYERKDVQSKWLLDCRELLMTWPYLSFVSKLLWERLRPYCPEMVGGMTMSADPLISGLLYEAQADHYPLHGFIIRKEAKSVGLRKLVEGPHIRQGTRIVLLDDLLNSGRTMQAAMKALAAFEPVVVAVGIIVDFQATGNKWLQEQHIPLESLITLADLGLARRPSSDQITCELRWTWETLNNREYSAPKSSPCIIHNMIFVGSDNGFLLALTLDAEELWRYPTRDTERGIHSSPLVHSGKVYFGAYDGYIYCLDEASGALIWEMQAGQWIGSSPAVDPHNNYIFIGTKYDKAGGSLIALEADTGRLIWEFKASHYIHSSPTFDSYRNQVIVGADDGIIYAVDAAVGDLRWQFHTAGAVKGQPIVDEAGTCFVGSMDGFLYALGAPSGQLLWKKRLAYRLFMNPLLYNDLVIVGTYLSHVVALDRQSGTIRWLTTTGGSILGGAALVQGSLIALGSADGCVYLLNGDSGAVLWSFQTGGPIRTTPATSSNLCLVPSCDGKLYAFSF